MGCISYTIAFVDLEMDSGSLAMLFVLLIATFSHVSLPLHPLSSISDHRTGYGIFFRCLLTLIPPKDIKAETWTFRKPLRIFCQP